jgi:hypothetical protein
METLTEIIAKCEALGHTMKNDPPFLGGTRFTCTKRECGRAVLKASGAAFWYGSALTKRCGERDE